ncbi:MAG: TetR family transcriptional regulator [Parvibaculaceae bacterium]|nr:TetR family transcriptional regulator [Parvibaculaceae bacterium]
MLKKTKQVRAEKTRDGLLRAAIDVVGKVGYENARIQDISDSAGVTPGAILYHFRNLETLLMEAFRADFEGLMQVAIKPDFLASLAASEIVDRTFTMLDDKDFRTRIGVLAEFLIAGRNDSKRQKLVEEVMCANRDRMVVTFAKGLGRDIDGDRLWQIIDIAVSLLIVDQLNYPNSAKSECAYQNTKPFIERELTHFLEGSR